MNLAIKHNKDRSFSKAFSCSKCSQSPAPYTKAEQLNYSSEIIHIGLGHRKAEEKTDSDKHYIATSAKCIVRIREMICFPVLPSGDIKLSSVSFFLLFAQLMSSHHFLSTSTTCLYCTFHIVLKCLTESMNNVAPYLNVYEKQLLNTPPPPEPHKKKRKKKIKTHRNRQILYEQSSDC